jgi:hypothetical protein
LAVIVGVTAEENVLKDQCGDGYFLLIEQPEGPVPVLYYRGPGIRVRGSNEPGLGTPPEAIVDPDV